MTPPLQDDTCYEGVEVSILTGTEDAFLRPWHKDRRWWIRWPAHVWHICCSLFPREQITRVRPASYSYWLRKAWLQSRRSDKLYSILWPLLQGYWSLLLLFLPPAIVAAALPVSDDLVLFLNFFTIVPLAALMHSACEDLSASMSPIIGKVFSAFSDNTVELVVSYAQRASKALLSLIFQDWCCGSYERRKSSRTTQFDRKYPVLFITCEFFGEASLLIRRLIGR